MATFQLNKVYTFNVLGASVLGYTTMKNAKLISIMDYSTARKYDNIDVKYRSIYPVLPQGTIDSIKSCIYYRFINVDSNEEAVLADQWIDMASIVLVEGINFQVTFTNGSTDDMRKVRNALNNMGFTNYDIKQI